jgi:hypothetical protein
MFSCDAPLQQAKASRVALGALFGCIALCWATQAHTQNCSEIFAAIKREAMYCGFFCDQERIRSLQQSYEMSCIKSLVAPSLFDLDSASIDAIFASPQKNQASQATYAE